MVKRAFTYCRICEAACGLVVDFDGTGKPAVIRPDRSHPVSRGFVCAKGTQFLDVAQHRTRLLHPMRRRTDGKLERIRWDEAMEAAANRIEPILERHGPHSVGVYYGNPIAFNVQGLVALLGFLRGLGSRNVYSAGSQDCNNKFAGGQIVHGSPLIHPLPDFDQTDLALLFGSNPFVSQSSFIHLEGGATVFDRLIERGGETIWIDPQRTESARRWGRHLPIRPGTDVWLMLALIQLLSNQFEPEPQVTGMEQLIEFSNRFSLAKTAAITGIPSGTMRELAGQISRTDRTAFHMSVGVNQGPFGTLAYVALQALAYLSGNYDRAGGVVFHPLAGLAAKLVSRLGFGASKKTSRIGGFTTSLNSLPGAILADEILAEGPEQIRTLIVIAGDPLKSIPGEKRLREAFKKLDTLVCIDLFENGTGHYADLLLPATSWLERWDVATTTALFQQSSLLQYAGPIMEPPGEARPEVQILSELASAIGRPLYRSRLLNGSLRLSWDGALSRLTSLFAHLEKPVGGCPPYAFAVPKPRPGRYLGRGPLTPDHRVRFWDRRFEAERVRMDDFASQVLRVREPGVFLLIGRRRRIGHNSWLHNGRRGDSLENAAWLSAADLKRLGIPDGGRLCVRSEAGELTIRARPNDGVMRGTIVIPHGLQGVNANALIPSGPDRAERMSGQHWMTGIPVRIEVIEVRGGVEQTIQCEPI